jgi:hypothetical protein
LDITHIIGGGIIAPSLAAMDVDQDGHMDVVMGDALGRMWLLHNISNGSAASFDLIPLIIERSAAAYIEVIDTHTARLYFGLPHGGRNAVICWLQAANSPISGQVTVVSGKK